MAGIFTHYYYYYCYHLLLRLRVAFVVVAYHCSFVSLYLRRLHTYMATLFSEASI